MKALSKTDRSLLRLSTRESLLIATLESEGPQSVSKLHRETRIPRTTVHFLLQKLRERDLVKKVRIQNHEEWEAVPVSHISHRLLNVVGKFDISHELIGNIISTDTTVKVFKGKRQLENAYKLIFEAGDDRVFFIQGHHSATESRNRFDEDYLKTINEHYREHGTILECLLGRETLKVFSGMSIAELESHLDRRVILYLIPDEHIDFDLDIMIIKDLIVFINASNGTVILLTSKAISEACRKLYDFMKSNAQKIDLNGYIRNLIAEKKSKVSATRP